MNKLLHCISSLDLNSGGPSKSVWSLVSGLRVLGEQTSIVTFNSKYSDEAMIGYDEFVQYVPAPRFNRFGYSRNMKLLLSSIPTEIFHGHGLWQYPVHAMAKAARKKYNPYIISPRGMLYAEALKKSSWYKKLAMLLFQRKDLNHAAVIHATCKQEMQQIRNLGFKNPIAVVPNAVDIKPIDRNKSSSTTTKKRVGFIGRFAPIKNIENLLTAWAASGRNNSDWELIIIGDGPIDYKTSLVQLSEQLKITNIVFTGFLFGYEKDEMLQTLNYLVLPSKSENFGMVVPEALLQEIPVIASKGTPWEELNTHSAGWWIDIGVAPLTAALTKAMQLSDEKRAEMGRNGRRLVEEKYSIEVVARQMIQLYEWVLGKGEKPEFVFTAK